MDALKINGGNRLEGEITIQGAKNAVLPVLAGAVLNKGSTVLYNCPKISDVESMINILMEIGCCVHWEGNALIINAKNIMTCVIPENFVREMRSSIILLGSVLGRLNNVIISFPGGCSIGTRPIDLHLKALRQMNVEIIEKHGFIKCKTNKIIGCEVNLDYPSVGATENIMLAAVQSEGVTKINNAAKEPEIVDLQNFLNAMGAKVSGAGTDEILIKGVKKLHDVEYTIIPDRIVAGTYLVADAMASGSIVLKNTINSHLNAITAKLREMGCHIKEYDKAISISAPEKLYSIDIIRTQPYPGFPTDMQSQIMSALSVAEGTSILSETIFEARFKHVNELQKMGANIIIDGRTAIIKGIRRLNGAEVYAKDLRGGAALILAGLNADGITYVNDIEHVLRGYEDIVRDLKQIGADISLAIK